MRRMLSVCVLILVLLCMSSCSFRTGTALTPDEIENFRKYADTTFIEHMESLDYSESEYRVNSVDRISESNIYNRVIIHYGYEIMKENDVSVRGDYTYEIRRLDEGGYEIVREADHLKGFSFMPFQ